MPDIILKHCKRIKSLSSAGIGPMQSKPLSFFNIEKERVHNIYEKLTNKSTCCSCFLVN
jgi:hypothetical protein